MPAWQVPQHRILDDDCTQFKSVVFFRLLSGKRVKHMSKSVEFTVQPKNSSVQCAAAAVVDVWCRRSLSAGRNDLWLETIGGTSTLILTARTHQLALSMVSLGAFTSTGRYVCHWKSERTKATSVGNNTDCLDSGDFNYYNEDKFGRNIRSTLMAGFEYDNDIITVSWTDSASAMTRRMEISFDSLADGVVFVTRDRTLTDDHVRWACSTWNAKYMKYYFKYFNTTYILFCVLNTWPSIFSILVY